MEIRENRQDNPVADELSALVAVIGPVIAAVFKSIPADITAVFGEYEKIPLGLLGRLRKEGRGDCGIAFEYSVHDAVMSKAPHIAERISDALHACGIPGDPASILFGLEKSGAQELISTEPGLVLENSPVLLADGGKTVSLRAHLSATGAAFRLPESLLNLAQSIRGLWKTELFLGSADHDRWVAASVSPSLPPPRGPRIAVIPAAAGRSDAVRRDEQRDLVVCPVPQDGGFLQVFHEGWRIVQSLCGRDFAMPGAGDMPSPVHREAARILVERRDFPIPDVIDAIRKFAQPGLLTSSAGTVPSVAFETTAVPATSMIITPIARTAAT